jgi:hypothetical protein
MSLLASAVLMVEPTTFGFDEQTAATNVFAHDSHNSAQVITSAALAEYAAVVAALSEFGVDVVSYAHRDGVTRHDGVFPNNWLTTWPDGRVFLYPMATPSRRVERSSELLLALRERFDMKKTDRYLGSGDGWRLPGEHGGDDIRSCQSDSVCL